MIMKMKKAVLANKFKFSILRSVGKSSTYPFTISAVVRELRSALKDFGDVKNPAEIVKAGDPSIVALAQAINSNTESVEAMTRAYQTDISKIVDRDRWKLCDGLNDTKQVLFRKLGTYFYKKEPAFC